MYVGVGWEKECDGFKIHPQYITTAMGNTNDDNDGGWTI